MGSRGTHQFIVPVTGRKAVFVTEFKIADRIRTLELVHKYGIAFFGKNCYVVWEE